MINAIATIAIIISLIAFNTFAVIHLNNKLQHLKSMVKEINNDLENKMARVKSDTQPLVDKYKSKQRQLHWKQYNKWKDKIERLEIGICNKCSSENLSTLIFYDNDYPIQADFHCDDCCHCINKWEYREDNQ
ncbi:hypothetical protein ACJJAK_02075 [Staphylococcus equorum]|uniref:hypothetical protein n=1 Tax=Staphylococcus equorum TaxID=246432 RepID=UPI00403FDA2D